MGSPFDGEAAMSPASGYAGDSREGKLLYEPQAAAMASISIMKCGSQGKYCTRPLSR
jgi:hypothetical protein